MTTGSYLGRPVVVSIVANKPGVGCSQHLKREIKASVELADPKFIDVHILQQSRRQSSRLGGPSVYQGGPKFEIKRKSRCLQKRKLVNWGGARMSIGGPGPPGFTYFFI